MGLVLQTFVRKGVYKMKKVYCYDLNKEYNSAVEAAKRLNIDRTSIVKCCNLQRLTAGGMLWCYVKDKNSKVWRV